MHGEVIVTPHGTKNNQSGPIKQNITICDEKSGKHSGITTVLEAREL